jgi:glycosyltransferase involved in cell wall biosynthesis
MKKIKNKVKKKQLKNFKKILKKLNCYFYYVKAHPQAIIKAPFFLLIKGPNFFLKKLSNIEKIVDESHIPQPSFINFIVNIFFNYPFKKLPKAIKILFTKGPKGLIEKIKEKFSANYYQLSVNQQYQIWLKKNYPTKKDLEKQRKESKKFKYKPLISIITPVYNPEKEYLIECIESVINQSYENWELCLVDDASTKKYVTQILKYYQKKNQRIKVKFRKTNGHICRASNDALQMASGEYIGLLDHDDFLWPNALYEVVKLLNKKHHAQFIYSDEDKLDYDGKTHIEPFFKPDWSPDYLRSINYITHFAVLKKDLVEKVGGFRVGTEGAQDWDLFLRATWWLEKNISHCHPLDPKNPIQHISTILYSWRKSSTSTASDKHARFVKNYAYENQKKVLKDDLKRRNYQGWVEPTEYLGLWRVRYKIKDNPLVSIIIPTKDKYEYINRCLKSILKKTTYKNYELVIVDTGSKEEKVWRLYEKVKKLYPQTQILKWKKEFNFSAVCNFGAKKAKGEYYLFLNNDTEVITPDWIEGMLEHAQREKIGAVGARLLYFDSSIQHNGLILGNEKNKIKQEKGFVSNYFRLAKPELNYGIFSLYIDTIRNYSAITAACLLVKRKTFISVGNFEENFRIAFNDIDFCLKLLKNKLFNLLNPSIALYHYESLSVGKVGDKKRDLNEFFNEIVKMKKKWGKFLIEDKFFNKNLTLEGSFPKIRETINKF